MNEIVGSIGWLVVGIAMLVVVQSRVARRDRKYLWACLAAHAASAVILVWLTYNVLGGGDMEVYYDYGWALAEYVQRDPGRWAPEVVKLMFQIEANPPFAIYSGQGSSTATMIAISCFVMMTTAGAEYATGMAFSMLAFSGQIAMYFAFRRHFPDRYRTRLMVALLLVPSAVFWSSGVVKEAVAMGGIGWVVWGLNGWIVRHRRLSALLWMIAGATLVAISKAYVLFPMTVAAGVWWFWHHSLSTKGSVAIARKPVYMLGAAALAVFGMLGLGELFPEYSLEQLGEEAAELQYRGQHVEGGSNYQIGDPDTTTLVGQLQFAPVAMTAALFRPLLVEAHNAVAVINGLEMLGIKILWIGTLYRRGIAGTWKVVRSSPALMFCLVFTLLFGLGIGLATTNLGTLSRYRVPMMPMYVLLLAMVWPQTDR